MCDVPGAAVIRIEEALKSFPSSSRLWFALKIAANFRLDKNEEAERALRKAVSGSIRSLHRRLPISG